MWDTGGAAGEAKVTEADHAKPLHHRRSLDPITRPRLD